MESFKQGVRCFGNCGRLRNKFHIDAYSQLIGSLEKELKDKNESTQHLHFNLHDFGLLFH